MDILIVILALMGLVLIPWGTAAGISTLLGTAHNAPVKTVYPSVEDPKGHFFVRGAYYDYGDRRFYARVEQYAGTDTELVSSSTLKGLEQEVRKVYRKWREEWPVKHGYPLEYLDS